MLNRQDECPDQAGPEASQITQNWVPRAIDPQLANYNKTPVAMPQQVSWLTASGRVRISGSDHGRWIVERLSVAFCSMHPDIAFEIDLRGTPSAMAFLMNGKSMFSVMGREITPVETVPYVKRIGAPPMAVRVAHTAEETSQHLATSLAVYVHRSNPVDRLTMVELSKIFTIGNEGGDYSRWGQLGLTGEWKARQIHPIGTPEFTGFGTYMQKHHLGGRPLNPFYERYVGTGDVLGRLEADTSGIAVAAIGCETADIRLVPVATEADSPFSSGTSSDVRNNNYAFGRFLYFYIPQRPNEPLDPLLVEYLHFVLSAEGQAIIAEQPGGYIPLRHEEAEAERATLKATITIETN